MTVQEMDHRFQVKDADQEAKICNAMGVIAGIWLRGDVEDVSTESTPWDPEHGTEMTMSWDEKAEQVVWTGWRKPDAKAAKVLEVVDIAGLD